MKLTRNKREVDDIRDCGNENWWTFFEEPGGYRIGLLGQLERILEISDSVVGQKVEKSRGVAGDGGKWGDAVVESADRESRRLDILT